MKMTRLLIAFIVLGLVGMLLVSASFANPPETSEKKGTGQVKESPSTDTKNTKPDKSESFSAISDKPTKQIERPNDFKNTVEKPKEHFNYDNKQGFCIGTKEFKVCSKVDAGNLFQGKTETTGYSVGVKLKFDF
ncbi:MAG: hypothetical protein AB1746_12890 [Candidatus Zixiibacteriota bacterium]